MKLLNVENVQFTDTTIALTPPTGNLILKENYAETITGTSENDIIDGNGGSDFINGGNGTDTAVFFGNSSDFTVTNLSGAVRVTGLSSAPSWYSYATMKLLNVEKLQFLDKTIELSDSDSSAPIEFKTTTDNVIVAALNLSARAYSDGHYNEPSVISEINTRVESWTPLKTVDLGFSETDPRFEAGRDLLRYDFDNASATAGLTILDGKRTLGIAFEGTNGLLTEDMVDNITNIDKYYHSLSDFTEAIFAYIMKDANGIEQVLVAGHSLGGATAQNFMYDYGHINSKFIGVTFGSPGTNYYLPLPEERFVNIRHTNDFVVGAGEARLYEVSGSIINASVKNAGHTLFNLPTDSEVSYRETVEFITSQLDAKNLFRDMSIVSGTNGDDNLDATSGMSGEFLIGGNGTDTMEGQLLGSYTQTFKGGLGNDNIDGGGGIDTAIYSGPRLSYLIELNDRFLFDDQRIVTDKRTGSNTDGTDTLENTERLIFSDSGLAFDLDGSAGKVAKLIGAVFGAGSVSNADYVAIGLSYLDSGTSYEDLAALAIDAVGANSPEQVVSLLWNNVAGSLPTTDQIRGVLKDLGTSSGKLGIYAADHSRNEANINMVGLTENGIVFDPLHYQPFG